MDEAIQNKENDFIKRYYHIPWDMLNITFGGGSWLVVCSRFACCLPWLVFGLLVFCA